MPRTGDNPVRPTDDMAVVVGDESYPVRRLTVREVIAFAEASDPDDVGRILDAALGDVPADIVCGMDDETLRSLVRYVLTGSSVSAGHGATTDPVDDVYDRVTAYAMAYATDPDTVLDRPWLDVLYWADAASRQNTQAVEQAAVMDAIALRNPAYFIERAEREHRARDKRTPDEIFASVVACESRGWN